MVALFARSRSVAAAGVLAVLAGVLTAAVVISNNQPRPVALTYWEEKTGLPSKQQRWYQWMSNQDAGPPIGNLGQGWDGVDRVGMFEGDGPEVLPRFSEETEVEVPLPQDKGAVSWLLGPQFNTPDNSKLF